MGVTVSYKGNTIINETNSFTKKMDTSGKYMEDDVTITYTASSEQSSASDPYEIVDAICNNTCLYFKSNASYTLPWMTGNLFSAPTSLRFFSMRNLMRTNSNKTLQNGVFRGMSNLEYANLGNSVDSVAQNGFNSTQSLKTLIIGKKRSPFVLSNSNNLLNSGISAGTGYVYVPDLDEDGEDLVEKYKTATYWSAVANQIKGFSEAPAYNDSTTYSLGDVCKYNGKFYGYCKSDLTNSVGNAPTGTTNDNAYWEYIAEIEVA